MIRKIIEIGHPALREIAKPVPKADIASKEIQRLVEDLIDTMRYCLLYTSPSPRDRG